MFEEGEAAFSFSNLMHAVICSALMSIYWAMLMWSSPKYYSCDIFTYVYAVSIPFNSTNISISS
jgi:hypothetical protein